MKNIKTVVVHFRFESLSKTKEKHEAEMEPLTKVKN